MEMWIAQDLMDCTGEMMIVYRDVGWWLLVNASSFVYWPDDVMNLNDHSSAMICKYGKYIYSIRVHETTLNLTTNT